MKIKLLLFASLSLLCLTSCSEKNPDTTSTSSETSIEITEDIVTENTSESTIEESTEKANSNEFNENIYTSRPYSEFKEKKFDYNIKTAKYSCNFKVDGSSFYFPDSLNDINMVNNLEATKQYTAITESVNNIEFTFKGGKIICTNDDNISLNYYEENGNIFLIIINNILSEDNTDKITFNNIKCGDSLDFLKEEMGEPTFVELNDEKEIYVYEDSNYSISFESVENSINRILIFKK